jgi:uncharacterized protein YneR
MIQHTVVFKLKHAKDSPEESAFLKKARQLWKIPNVIDFRLLRQVGGKNEFTHGLSMYFTSESAYQAYNDHPDHLHFVNDVWLPEVEDFLEIDYVEIND